MDFERQQILEDGREAKRLIDSPLLTRLFEQNDRQLLIALDATGIDSVDDITRAVARWKGVRKLQMLIEGHIREADYIIEEERRKAGG